MIYDDPLLMLQAAQAYARRTGDQIVCRDIPAERLVGFSSEKDATQTWLTGLIPIKEFLVRHPKSGPFWSTPSGRAQLAAWLSQGDTPLPWLEESQGGVTTSM